MVTSSHPPSNSFVAKARKIYNPIGFGKGYNAVLWFICSGYLMGFTLARFSYMDFYGTFCSPRNGMNHAGPGECFYYLKGHYTVGIILHLVTILPAAFLVCFQFVPYIRHKAILFHRINGYLVITLSLLGTVGALMIARVSFGGGLDTQGSVGLLSIMFLGSLLMGVINIKRLQIEQHRAWMLRAWVYAGCIITSRLILIIAINVITMTGGYYSAQPCDKINFILGQNMTLQRYPECAALFSGENLKQHAVVVAAFANKPDEIAASMNLTFGTALWISLVLHFIGVEIYLRLTPAEFERLRQFSYQRQLEAGMKHPGRAGLTVDRFGDAERWVPAANQREKYKAEETFRSEEEVELQ